MLLMLKGSKEALTVLIVTHVTVTGLRFEVTSTLKKHVVEDDIVYKSSGSKIGNSSRGCGVLPFCMGRTWFKLAVTGSNWFLPVVAHDKYTV